MLVVGSGGVGSAIAAIAQRRSFFDHMALADLDGDARSARGSGPRASQTASRRSASTPRIRGDRRARHGETGADVIVNACDPRLNPPIFDAAFDAGCTYLDMAMTLSEPHPERPYEQPGVMLGDEQFAAARALARARACSPSSGMGVEPGLSDVFARYAADHLFSEIDEIGVRDGANLVVDGYAFAPTFSIWTTIEECLNPPLIWERDRGWYTTRAVLRAGGLRLPRGHRPGRVRQRRARGGRARSRARIDCRRVTFKYGLGEEFIEVLRTLHLLGLDSKEPVDVRGAAVAPRDLVAAVLPDPADAR